MRDKNGKVSKMAFQERDPFGLLAVGAPYPLCGKPGCSLTIRLRRVRGA